jgi:predicted regulator of Ras-like GTPase activity (Roadblock/LC7/MglB family)
MPRDAALADHIGQELRLIRERVPGVRGSVAATSDGILIAHDVTDLEPTQIAALVAAMHAVAVRVTLSTESGQLRDVITRASDGYLAVYAAGSAAIVAVLGTTELNIAILNYQTRTIIERVAGHLSDIARRPQTNPGYPPSTPWAPPEQPERPERPEHADAGGDSPLPTRRSAAKRAR